MAAADKPHAYGLGVLWVSMLLVLLTSAFLVQGLIVGDEVQAAGFAAELDGEWVAIEESSATVTSDSLPTDSLHQHHNLGLDNATEEAAPAATAAEANHHGAGQTTASSRLLEESASEEGSQGAASGGSDAASGELAAFGGEKRAVHHRRGHRRSSGSQDGSHARSQGRRSSGRGSRRHRNKHRGHSPKRGSGGNGGGSWGEGTGWQVVPDADGPKVRPRSPDGKPENWQEVSSTNSQEEVINRDHGHGTKPGNTLTEKGEENEEGEHHMYHDHYHEHEHEHEHNHFFHRGKPPKGTYADAASHGSKLKTDGQNHKA